MLGLGAGCWMLDAARPDDPVGRGYWMLDIIDETE